MKRPQRKRLIKEEKWPLIDGWYWCPNYLVEKRIAESAQPPIPASYLKPFGERGPITPQYKNYVRWIDWVETQRTVYGRLAHHCTDGKPRAPYVEYGHTRKKRLILKGNCWHCKVKLSRGIKALIIMELEL